MQSFKITKEELATFAKRLYQEACCGYMDLCDATTEKMLEEFLNGRTPVFAGVLDHYPPSNTISPSVRIGPNDLSFVTGQPFTSGSYTTSPTFTIGVDPAGRPGFPDDTHSYNTNNPYPSSLETAIRSEATHEEREALYRYSGHGGPAYEASMSVQQGTELHTEIVQHDGREILPGNSIALTETPVIREEVFVRPDFAGNESERF